MQTPKVKATLSKLLSDNKLLSQIRAVLYTGVTGGISESETESERSPAVYMAIKECRIAKIQGELMQARGLEEAHRIRQRIL